MGTKHQTTQPERLARLACQVGGSGSLIADVRDGMAAGGIAGAVRGRDSGTIYDWLIEAVSYQGVSDAVATTYMEQHGKPCFAGVSLGLSTPSCPRLTSYWHYEGCGYHKGSQTCTEPEHFRRCHVPLLDLRNGRLNQSAHSLRLFFRDIADDDIVGWIDRRLEQAANEADGHGTRAERLRKSLLEPLGWVHGLSSKVISMALADLLLGADPERLLWVETGASMIAIDTLVHNWLHRTGILAELEADHPYGPRCYAPGGCAHIIERFAARIDARAFNSDYPAYFPRFVQKAIWRFCAQAGFDQCNGNQIDDRYPCKRPDCALGRDCRRAPLRVQAI
jgi:hypothetical protein